MTTPSPRERIEGGLWGLLVGDALGVPYEFHPRSEIPPPEQIEYEPPEGFHRAHAGTPPGTFSDDGAQALCLLASLLDRGGLELGDLGSKLLAWHERGYLAVDGRVFDCGIQTAAALRAMRGGSSPWLSGSAAESANGNGSLMRVLPLALWHQGPDDQLVEMAHAQSMVTHRHARAQACCAFYCLWARRTFEGHPSPWQAAASSLRDIYEGDLTRLGELEYHVRPDDEPAGQGSGYVVDCLRSARWAALQGPYEQAVKAAVGLGKDTDTTACVAGGIAGLRDGVGAIPERWRQALRGQELFAPLLERLLAWRGL